MKFSTLDDVNVEDKTVILRVDINSPLDPETKEMMDDYRIKRVQSTIEELSERGAKIAVVSHQGRPGGDEFTTLESHGEMMNDVLDVDVDYVDDLFGPTARESIKNLEPGEVLLLENARFYSEETLNRPPEVQAKTPFVQKLSPLLDIFVNDAFAAAHRSQVSLVGFGVPLETVAGKLMEKELQSLKKAKNPEHPCVYSLGGTKADDTITLIDHALAEGTAEKIIVGGFVANIFLAADGRNIGEKNMETVREKGYEDQIERASKILKRYRDKIELPSDLRIETEDGEAKVIDVNDLPTEYPIYDIGDETIRRYKLILDGANTVLGKGPLGVFEKEKFAKGTHNILEKMTELNAHTQIGGGHLVAAAREMGIDEKINHVSTGGGACLLYLSGEELPVVEVLLNSKEKYG